MLVARLQHFRLHTQPSCAVVSFVERCGAYTIEETQLFMESLVPYLFHDMEKFGMPMHI